MSGVETQNPFLLLDDDAPAAEAGAVKESSDSKPNLRSAVPAKAAARGGGRGGAAGPAARGSGNRPPKREFDRHSGTGRGKEVPKGGRGAHNWGSAENPADSMAPETVPEAAENAADAPADAAPAEEEDAAKTYDDYLAQLQAKVPEDDKKLQVRAAVVDEKQFKKGTVLQVKEEESLFADVAVAKNLKQKNKDRSKKAISIDEFVAPIKAAGGSNDDDRDEFGGGYRGRGRGGAPRGRGGFRGNSDGSAPRGGGGRGRGGRGGAGGEFRGGRGGGEFRGRGGRGRGEFRGNSEFRGRGGAPRGGSGGRGVDLSEEAFPSLGK